MFIRDVDMSQGLFLNFKLQFWFIIDLMIENYLFDYLLTLSYGPHCLTVHKHHSCKNQLSAAQNTTTPSHWVVYVASVQIPCQFNKLLLSQTSIHNKSVQTAIFNINVTTAKQASHCV